MSLISATGHSRSYCGSPGPALYANLTSIRQLKGGLIDIGPALLQRSVDGGQTWTALPIPTSDD